MKRIGFIFLTFSFIVLFFHCSYGQAAKYQVVGVGQNVNSPYDEQAPVLSPDGQKLYFTRSKHQNNSGGSKDPGDIWISEMDDSGNWKVPENAGPVLNNRQYNAIIGFTDKGNTVYLTGHYLPGNKKAKSKGISVSYYNNGNWTFPEPVDIPYFSNYSDQQSGCLSYDGNVMLHSLESYNTRGAEDIYVSFRKTDGSWTDVQNLGSNINTQYQEKTPFLSADNKTLFFASNGLPGSGSMDLFRCKRLDDTWKNWSEPVNLGPPINSNGRELYYFVVPGNDEAIFCSTQNSDGYGDIKYYKLMPADVILPVEEAIIAADTEIQEVVEKEDVIIVQGKVFNAENNDPVIASISVFYPGDDEESMALESQQGTGAFQLKASADNDFLIRVAAKGFMNVEESINISDYDQNLVLKNYYLEPLDVGKVFKLNNVLFHKGTSNLIDSSYIELDIVYRMMFDNPDIAIELSGHTDNVGNAKKNLDLSQQRVEVVKLYLVEKGIHEERISGRGYGGSQPIASNKSEVTRRLNRRVEFKIVEKESP
jgi:outer membrane protein OmpA-like peptidoglycan-associated protein